MRKLRNIIRWFTPYGLVNSYAKRHKKAAQRNNFIVACMEYANSNHKCELLDTSPYKTIVSIQGFGYSGSGALVDLMREYDCVHVIGNVDYEGSASSRDIQCEEIDILRLAGGLFEVEKYLDSNNIFQNDALLHRVIAQLEHSDLYKKMPKIRPYLYEYFTQICMIRTDMPESQQYNPYLDYKGNNDILFLKNMVITEYRNLCQKLLNSIFYEIYQHSPKDILVLDQLFGDFEYDTNRYREYVPNIKILAVYRDPRDVYTFTKSDNVDWIPCNTVNDFVEWCKVMFRRFNNNEQKEYLAIQFEDLIINYEMVVPHVESFIGIPTSNHLKIGQHLDVSRSVKNIGLWKKGDGKSEYEVIQKELRKYCYNK